MGSEPPLKKVNSLSFKAVAVIAATDVKGKLVNYLIRDFSIKKDDIVEFLQETSWELEGSESYLFLDNLRAHHSREVAAEAKRNNQTLLFNGGYSS